MSTALKTGDVKRYPLSEFGYQSNTDGWAVISKDIEHCTWPSRASARCDKLPGERIARVLSIGKKLVTVRIEK